MISLRNGDKPLINLYLGEIWGQIPCISYSLFSGTEIGTPHFRRFVESEVTAFTQPLLRLARIKEHQFNRF